MSTSYVKLPSVEVLKLCNDTLKYVKDYRQKLKDNFISEQKQILNKRDWFQKLFKIKSEFQSMSDDELFKFCRKEYRFRINGPCYGKEFFAIQHIDTSLDKNKKIALELKTACLLSNYVNVSSEDLNMLHITNIDDK